MPAQYPNNLQELLGGGMASINATLNQQRNAEAQDTLDQQRQTLANQFAQQVNPIKVQQEQSNLDTLNAALPGVRADSRMKQIQANIGEATQDSDIKTKLSKDLTSMSNDQITRLNNQGQAMVQMADLADSGQMPTLEQQQALPPGLVKMLNDPEGRAKLRKQGALITQHIASHMNDMEKENAGNATKIQVANIMADSRVRAAELRAQKHSTGTDLMLKAMTSGNPEAVANAYAYQAQLAAEDGDKDKAQYLNNKALEFRQRANEVAINKRPPAIDVPAAANGGVIQTPPVPKATAPSLPGQSSVKRESDGSITLQ